MLGPLRSKHGCWTCRLRRKKCDEIRPECETCASMSITCYGFGPKPEWMDNNEKRRAVASKLAEMVKNRASSRKTASRIARGSTQLLQLAPKPALAGTESAASPHQDQTTLTKPGLLVSQPESGHTVTPKASFKVNPAPDEYGLLMHYLDSVFPLQLPLYKPDVAAGGRGWLLSMLLRTKPLYHAVLALSAYHRRMIMCPQGSPEWLVEDEKCQEDNLAICLEIVHQSTSGSCSTDGSGVGITAAIIQLLFIELFTNHSNGWQAHLHVLSRMFQHVYTKDLINIGLSDQSRSILLGREELGNQSTGVREEVMGFRTLGATTVWLDLILSVTTGTAPSPWPASLFCSDSISQVRLQDIMGCQNWAMIQIGHIAELHEQISRATEHNCTELMQSAEAIHNDIQNGLEDLGSLDLISLFDSLVDRDSSGLVALITYLYAQTALIYLHLVLHGFKDFQHVGSSMSVIKGSIQCGINSDLRPALVFPIFICGSVADESERDVFRSVLSNPPLMDSSLQHRVRVLQVLEDIWAQRQSMPVYTWNDCLILSSNILLH